MQENLVKEATQAARTVLGMDTVTEQDIQLVGDEQEQTMCWLPSLALLKAWKE